MRKTEEVPTGGGFGGAALSAEEEAKHVEDQSKKRAEENERPAVEDKAVRGPKEREKP